MRLSWATVAALAVSSVRGAAETVRGIAPSQIDKYTPYTSSAGKARWKCLDGSAELPWSAVNDDYCDCADGSDEPGTSACPNSTFYCVNEGHIPARIRASRVNDGICDPECCDGTDETDGKIKCPNTCEKVGRVHRKRLAEMANLHRAGGKIRDKYISDGRKQKEALQAEIVKLEIELQVATEREEQLKRELHRAESVDKVAIDAKVNTPLYKTLTAHQAALDALLQSKSELKDELTTLTLLLDDLAKGYNPNNQDMAVKGAVVAYNEWRGTPIKTEDDDTAAPNVKLDTLLQEGNWTSAKIADMVRQDPLDLMDSGVPQRAAAHSDRHVSADGGLLFRIHEYLPDPLVPYFEAMVDTLLDVLLKANIITDVKRMRPREGNAASGDTAEPESVAAARTAHTAATTHLTRTRTDLENRQTKLDNFAARFGRQHEFKTLENTCISKDMGEYTYEYCFFGQIKQIPNKGGSTVSLGTFANWSPRGTFSQTDDGYWMQQAYTRGQKCWNGPERSAIVDLQCDTSNAVLDVFEAEKCIYSIKISTPAVCFGTSTTEAPHIKDEL